MNEGYRQLLLFEDLESLNKKTDPATIPATNKLPTPTAAIIGTFEDFSLF